MAETSIEWTATDGIAGMTWNPVTGCTRVSAGCDNCYAAQMTHRLDRMGEDKYRGLTVLNARGERHFNGVVRTHDDALRIPLKWRKPRRVFVNSMSDLFHRDVPFAFIDKVFAVMALCPQHTFMVLTKRPERMAEYCDQEELRENIGTAAGTLLDGDWIHNEGKAHRAKIEFLISACFGIEIDDEFDEVLCDDLSLPLPNVMLGTSIENQATANQRIPHLLKVPAAVRFLSCEPLLGRVDLTDPWYASFAPAADAGSGWKGTDTGGKCPGVQWVIAGGESGQGARPCDIDWIRDLRDQCKAAGVAFFNKQLGSSNRCEHSPKGGCLDCMPEDLRVREWPEVRR